jgi:hypothetical protein
MLLLQSPEADLPTYEFKDAMTSFRRYQLRNPVEAAQAASEHLPPIKKVQS